MIIIFGSVSRELGGLTKRQLLEAAMKFYLFENQSNLVTVPKDEFAKVPDDQIRGLAENGKVYPFMFIDLEGGRHYMRGRIILTCGSPTVRGYCPRFEGIPGIFDKSNGKVYSEVYMRR